MTSHRRRLIRRFEMLRGSLGSFNTCPEIVFQPSFYFSHVLFVSRSVSGESFFCSFSSLRPLASEDTVLPSSSGSRRILHGTALGLRCFLSSLSSWRKFVDEMEGFHRLSVTSMAIFRY
jgi:hypothetical protein